MGTLTGQQIVDRARVMLQDVTPVRWLDAELLNWINDAQRDIVLVKPNANSVVGNITLVAGTKQDLPSAGILLLNVVRNVANGDRAIRRVDRNILDSEIPAWHAATAAAAVEHFVFDEDAPTTFWVYPPQPSSGFGTVQTIYSTAPTNLASLANTIALNDIYAGAILDFVLYRAYLKDTDYAGNSQRAQAHYAAYQNALGNKIQNEQSSSPNQNVRTQRSVA